MAGLLVLLLSSTAHALPNYQGCVSELAKQQQYCNLSLTHDERATALVATLTLDEKVSRMYSCLDDCDTCPCAVARVGLSEYAYLLEANTAVAAVCLGQDRCATVFPGPNGMGASFNRSLWRTKGRVLSTEVRAFANSGGVRGLGKPTGIATFGPNVNIERDPRFGRNSELPGEDPFHAGEYAAEVTLGMQEEDKNGHPRTISYLKHFTAYSRETDRGHDTYNISAYDFEDTYLPAYERGMSLQDGGGGASGLMCSYNAENGIPSCANGWLLNDVLRERWGRHDAVVTTDSGAIGNLRGDPANAPSDAVAAAWALNNGTDVNDGHGWAVLADAVNGGLTTEAQVDTALFRSLRQLFWAGLFDPVEDVEWASIGAEAINSTAHQAINAEASLQALVLLKNAGNALPLKHGASVAVVGPMADNAGGLLSDYATEQACFQDSGDCQVTIFQGIAAENAGGRTVASQGVEINSNNTDGIAAALAAAAAADVVVLALGNDKGQEGEGTDRTALQLPGLQSSFARQVLALGKPTVLVLVNGGAVAIDELLTDPHSPGAVVEAFNPNVVGATALATTLFGRSNRWSKLPYTIYPASYADAIAADNFAMSEPPGRTYRYYDGEPLFSFGFGLSYTEFGLNCTASPPKYQCTVSNLGAVGGDEVVFAWHTPGDDVRGKADHALPLKRLVGFERVSVDAGGPPAVVEFDLDDTALELVTASGVRTVYSGTHRLSFSNGVEEAVSFEVQVK